MKRKDMDRTVLYAISADGYNTRPGYVLDEGKPGTKVKVKVYWTWVGQDDDYLNPTPPLHMDGAKFDNKMVDTSHISGETWAEYTVRIKAERQAQLDKINADKAEAEAAKQAMLDRLEAVAPMIEGFDGFCDLTDLRYLLNADRQHDSRYSAKHVLQMLEYIAHRLAVDTGVSQ